MNSFSFNLQDFVFVWWALLYEAMPFVALGAIVSGFLERCLSRDAVVRFFPQNRVLLTPAKPMGLHRGSWAYWKKERSSD
jgi:uncharacterized membrane protein YraQ (UPF0718 family)